MLTGVDYVMHLAGPCDLKAVDYQTELIDPILNGIVILVLVRFILSVSLICIGDINTGTRAVMTRARNTPSVKRVLLTSCSCAICDEFTPGKLYTEVRVVT